MICPVYERVWKASDPGRARLIKMYHPDEFPRIKAWTKAEPSPNSSKPCNRSVVDRSVSAGAKSTASSSSDKAERSAASVGRRRTARLLLHLERPHVAHPLESVATPYGNETNAALAQSTECVVAGSALRA